MMRGISIAFLMVVLAGAIGVPFYQHTCLHEEKIIHTVFVASDHCEMMEHKQEQRIKPTCCQKTEQVISDEHSVSKGDCCLDEVSHWRFSCFFDRFTKFDPAKIAVIIPESFSGVVHEPVLLGQQQNDIHLFSGNDPPPPSVLERLAIHCIWRL